LRGKCGRLYGYQASTNVDASYREIRETEAYKAAIDETGSKNSPSSILNRSKHFSVNHHALSIEVAINYSALV
jgi:hypothetical protein